MLELLLLFIECTCPWACIDGDVKEGEMRVLLELLFVRGGAFTETGTCTWSVGKVVWIVTPEPDPAPIPAVVRMGFVPCVGGSGQTPNGILVPVVPVLVVGNEDDDDVAPAVGTVPVLAPFVSDDDSLLITE